MEQVADRRRVIITKPKRKPVQREIEDLALWGFIIHVSQFLSAAVPLLGLVVVCLIWASKKNQSKIMDRHGRNIINWTISSLVYLALLFMISLAEPIAAAGLAVIFGLISIYNIIRGIVYALKEKSIPYRFSFEFF